jgi:hypothetical protein
LSKSNFNSINGFSVLIGLAAAVFIYGTTYSITKDSYVSSIATIVGDGAVVVGTKYFFTKMRENDIKKGNEKYAPIATGSQALKKLAGIYPSAAEI